MNNTDMPASPLVVNGIIGNGVNGFSDTATVGLTKREHFAGLAMQGLLASDVMNELSVRDCYEHAIKVADGLLKELEK